tara:strand:- start:1201 stop:2151 length:951 start_codon:yes stop_codon:yes gene_type:complete
MSSIRKHIREILIEALSGTGSFSINPSIKRFCDIFLSGKNPELSVTQAGGKMEISLKADHKLVGHLDFRKTTKAMGPCLGAWRVAWTTSDPDFKGAGLICYELAIELLGTSEFGSGLIGDRKEVSHPLWKGSPVFLSPGRHKDKGFAYPLWKKYSSRSDVKKTLLDPLGFNFTPQPEDDCDAGSAFALYALERNKDYQSFIKKKRTTKELTDFGWAFQDDSAMKQRARKNDPLFGAAAFDSVGKRKKAFGPIIQNDPQLLAQIESEWKAYGIPLLIMISKDSLPTWEYLVSKGTEMNFGRGGTKIKRALGDLAKKK